MSGRMLLSIPMPTCPECNAVGRESDVTAEAPVLGEPFFLHCHRGHMTEMVIFGVLDTRAYASTGAA